MTNLPSRRAALGALAAGTAFGLTSTPLPLNAAHAGEGIGDAEVSAREERVRSLFRKTVVLSAQAAAACEDINFAGRRYPSCRPIGRGVVWRAPDR